MIILIRHVLTHLAHRAHLGRFGAPALGGDRGQATAEYALVLVGAATIATLLIGWASSTGRIAGLFDVVLRSVTRLVA